MTNQIRAKRAEVKIPRRAVRDLIHIMFAKLSNNQREFVANPEEMQAHLRSDSRRSFAPGADLAKSASVSCLSPSRSPTITEHAQLPTRTSEPGLNQKVPCGLNGMTP